MAKVNKNNTIKHQIIYSLGLLLFSLLFIQCGTEKYLVGDQTLVTKNKIEIVDGENVSNKEQLLYQLATFQEQKPNGNWLGLFPREGFYFRNSSPGDTSWWNRGVRNNIAEIPAIYDTSATARTRSGMELFMRNLKGYYNAEVTSEDTRINKTTRIKYLVKAGKRYHIDTVAYIGFSEEIINYIEEIKEASLLKSGEPIDVSAFDKEKSRITQYLQNKGYANFNAKSLKIYGDSSNLNQTVDIFLEVVPQVDSTIYQKYTIGDINVFTDFLQGQDLSKTDVKTQNGINYHKFSNSYVVKPSQLDKFISLKPGDDFNEQDRVKTFRKLNQLDVYRFSILKPQVSPKSDSILDFNIFLTPQSTKWISDFGLETFYSTVSTLGRQFLGASAFAALENRNLFGGGEKNRFFVELGAEVQFDLGIATSIFRVQDNLDIPTFLDVFRTGNFAHRIGIMTTDEFRDFRRDATTNITVGYSNQRITDLYDIVSFNSSIGYNYIRNRHQFNLRQLSLNLNNYNLDTLFLDRIAGNQFIENSLQDNLFTGFLFRDFNYTYKSPKSITGNSFRFNANIEVSGWEIGLLNRIGNSLSGNDNDWKLFNTFEFSKYVKLELDYSFYKDLTKNTSFASRVNLGIARPFFDTQQVPFIKQFYVGGPNGIRAWQIRELGPGSFDNRAIINASQLFFQQGDLKFQFSGEYRFDIISWIESAIFIDGGNVWTLDNTDTRLGAQFTGSFLNDIALGYGWGLRFDFDYFHLRFDFGYKLRSSFTNNEQERWIPLRGQNIGNINVAINYPF